MTCPDLCACVSSLTGRAGVLPPRKPLGARTNKQEIEIMSALASEKQFHARRKCEIRHGGSVFIDGG